MFKQNKGKLFLFSLMFIFILALSACGNNSNKAASNDDGNNHASKSDDGIYNIDDFPRETTNDKDPIKDGELTFGLVSDSPFKGTLNWNFYDGDPDAQILSWIDDPLLDVGPDFNYTDTGAATIKVSDDKKTFTLTIKDNVNWQDGEPVTAEDWAFAVQTIADKDYTGPRFDSTLRNIKGAEAYHDGKADSISGLEVVDEKTLKMTFNHPSASLLAGGIWPYAMPKHIFKDIPVKDMAKSDAVRKHPVGFGPYKVESIVPGESITLVRNDNYWRGTPNLKKVTIKVIDPSVVAKELEQGTVDMVSGFPADQYPDNADMKNVEFLGNVDLAYTYIGFKLGTWDKDKNEVKPDPDAKMADVNLRKAMWYAVDNDKVGENFYHGLRWNATTLIDPAHKAFHAEDIETPTFNPDKAKQILDDAGYKDTDGDGYREDKNGDELVMNFASMSGGDIAEPIAKYYIQAWKKVGLHVQLLDGRLQEFETFYDRVGNGGNDDPKVDIYMGAWSTGTDVNPAGLYGRQAMFNFSRYASDENDELLKEGISLKAFDIDYRKDIYKQWQQLMVDDVPVFPTLYRAKIEPVNKRVTNYQIYNEDKAPYQYQIGVTQDEPFKN